MYVAESAVRADPVGESGGGRGGGVCGVFKFSGANVVVEL